DVELDAADLADGNGQLAVLGLDVEALLEDVHADGAAVGEADLHLLGAGAVLLGRALGESEAGAEEGDQNDPAAIPQHRASSSGTGVRWPSSGRTGWRAGRALGAAHAAAATRPQRGRAGRGWAGVIVGD